MFRYSFALVGMLLTGQFGVAQDWWMPRRGPAPWSIRLHGDRLERHVEHAVKVHLGSLVDDVDVDVDDRRVEVEVELTHPAGLARLRRLLYSMPELAGYQIRIDVDWDD
jgi:hypothetical protein